MTTTHRISMAEIKEAIVEYCGERAGDVELKLYLGMEEIPPSMELSATVTRYGADG